MTQRTWRVIPLQLGEPIEIGSGRYLLSQLGLLVSFDPTEAIPTGITINYPWTAINKVRGTCLMQHEGVTLFTLFVDKDLIGIAVEEVFSTVPTPMNPSDLLQ